MKALFYSHRGKQVWSVRKDARFEFTNGSRAMGKGAVKGFLYDDAGNLIEKIEYKTKS